MVQFNEEQMKILVEIISTVELSLPEQFENEKSGLKAVEVALLSGNLVSAVKWLEEDHYE